MHGKDGHSAFCIHIHKYISYKNDVCTLDLYFSFYLFISDIYTKKEKNILKRENTKKLKI